VADRCKIYVIARSCVFLIYLVGFVTASLAAELNPSELPQAQLNRAKDFEDRKQYEQAVDSYRDYLKLRPEDDEVRGQIARLLSWQGHYDEALQLYDEILQRHPWDLDILTAKARIKSWQKKFAEARILYEKVLEKNPDDREAKRGLADILYWTGDYANALRAYEDLALMDQNPEIVRNIKNIRMELEALTQAQELRAPVGLRTVLPSLPFRDYVKVGYSHYSYTNSVPNEQDWIGEAGKSAGALTFVGRVESLNRFGFHDTPVSGEVYSTLWHKAWGYLGGSGTVNPHFAPNVTVGGEIFQNLAIVSPSLTFLEPSFGYRYLPYNIWITEKVFYVPETGATTLSSGITWRPTDRVQLSFSGAFGTASERIVAEQDFVRVPTLITQGAVIFPLSRYFSGELAGYYEDRETLYVRRGGTFNLLFHW
jgi:tetratricopeptide (TPR) repeat protein